jgi:hypothetical protein
LRGGRLGWCRSGMRCQFAGGENRRRRRKKERIKEERTDTRADAAVAALNIFVAFRERPFGLQC